VARQLRRRRQLALALVLGPPLLWLVGLYLIPLGLLLITSLWTWDGVQIVHTWTLDNFQLITSDPLPLTVFRRTLFVAVLVTLSSVILALPLAYFLVRYTSRWKNLLYLAVLIPLWTNYLVRVFAWKTILGDTGLLNSFLISSHVIKQPIDALLYSNNAVYITLLYIWLPYMVLPVYAAIDRIPPSLLEASSDLGARGWRTIVHVVWPLAFPGILAGSIFVFSLSMGDYITPEFMGNGSSFIGNLIATQFHDAGSPPYGAALSALPLAVLLVYLSVARRFGALEAL
jgi:putative spermidine/putrescine transport system permease protein